MRLTVRGVVVLVLAVVLLGTAEWLGYPLFRALSYVLFGLLIAAVAVTARPVRVEVTRDVYPDRVERGKPALAKLRVSGARQRGFLALDRAGDHVRAVRVPRLVADASFNYELPTTRRGRMTVGPLTLHRVDPFGLARNRITTGQTATVWVHPRRYPARAVVSGHSRHHHVGRTTDTLRGSVDLREVRPYVPGDEVRLLHWKATARTGQLMVRDYADPAQPRFTLLLDTRSDAFPAEMFEEAVDLAASLIDACALAGHHTRLVTSSGLDIATAGGPDAARTLLDELCEVRQERGTALAPVSMMASKGGGMLAVVTSSTMDISALSRERFSSCCVFDLGPGRPIAGLRVLHAAGAEQAVWQWNKVV